MTVNITEPKHPSKAGPASSPAQSVSLLIDSTPIDQGLRIDAGTDDSLLFRVQRAPARAAADPRPVCALLTCEICVHHLAICHNLITMVAHCQPFCLIFVAAVVVWTQHADGQSWPACYGGYLGCNAYASHVINQYILNGSGMYVHPNVSPLNCLTAACHLQ